MSLLHQIIRRRGGRRVKRPRRNGKKTFIVVAIIAVVAVGIGVVGVLAANKAHKSELAASEDTAKNDNKGSAQAGDKNGQQSDAKDNSQSSDSQNNYQNDSQSSDSQDSSKNGSQGSNSPNNSQNDSNSQSDTQSSSQSSEGTDSSASTYDPAIEEDNTAIHRYEFFISDCTWNEAFQSCIKRGGYLVRINSPEEYAYIRKEISKRGMTNIFFRIGGRRDSGSRDYYWVNAENKLFGGKLNAADSWCADEWQKGEPSFKDGNLEEKYMDLFFFDGEKRFVWNDVPDDMLAADPDYSGRLGYICEYGK